MGLAVDAPRVVVLDPGSGNLQRLEYQDISSEGAAASQEQTINIAQGFAQSIGDAASVDTQAPAGGDVTTFHLPVTASTTEAEFSDQETVSASRDISLTVGKPTFTDLTQVEDVNSTEGFTLGVRATDSGQHTTLSFAAPVDATDNGRMLMEQYLLTYTSLPIVFPAEDLGVGARWSVDSRVTGESTLLQTVTYTLNSIEGSTVNLDVEVSQRPSMGALEITDDETSDSAEQLTVLNSNTTSVGNLVVDLKQPLPTAGQVSWTTRVIYGGSNEQVRVVQDTTSSISFGDE
ncbi:hypothetical protein [Corynebacterium suranareeae]|uniref:hypothetical protein n=1 Tax=Corynebacterium suranareeae TaxID=2506452 RepID=UPI00142E6C68